MKSMQLRSASFRNGHGGKSDRVDALQKSVEDVQCGVDSATWIVRLRKYEDGNEDCVYVFVFVFCHAFVCVDVLGCLCVHVFACSCSV